MNEKNSSQNEKSSLSDGKNPLAIGNWRDKLGDRPKGVLSVSRNGQLNVTRRMVAFLLLDISESMERKLPAAKSGARSFAKEATAKGYEVGIIEFGSEARVVSALTKDEVALGRSLESIHINGSTNLADGIRLGISSLSSIRGERVLCVVTDGEPDDESEAMDARAAAVVNGISIMTLGTEGANHAFLKKLSTRTELSQEVTSQNLAIGVASMVRLLPG